MCTHPHTCTHKLEGHTCTISHAHILMSTTGTGIYMYVYTSARIQQYAVSPMHICKFMCLSSHYLCLHIYM